MCIPNRIALSGTSYRLYWWCKVIMTIHVHPQVNYRHVHPTQLRVAWKEVANKYWSLYNICRQQFAPVLPDQCTDSNTTVSIHIILTEDQEFHSQPEHGPSCGTQVQTSVPSCGEAVNSNFQCFKPYICMVGGKPLRVPPNPSLKHANYMAVHSGSYSWGGFRVPPPHPLPVLGM